MKFKRLAAVISAAAMLGSIGFALPVSAADTTLNPDTTIPEKVNQTTYDYMCSFTIPKNDVVYTTDSVHFSVKEGVKYQVTTGYEVKIADGNTAPSDFGIYYYLRDKNNRNIQSLVDRGKNLSSGSRSGSTYIFSADDKADNIATTTIGESGEVYAQIKNRGYSSGDKTAFGITITPVAYKVTSDTGYTIVSGVTDGYADANSYITYKKDGENQKYIVKITDVTKIGEATVGEIPTVYIGEAGYVNFNDALAAAKDNDTITLYENVTLNGRTKITQKGITIKSNGDKKKIEVKKEGNNGDLIVYGNFTLENTDVEAYSGLKQNDGNSTLKIIDSDVNIVEIGKIDGTLELDNANVGTVKTRVGINTAYTGANTVKGTGSIGTLVYNSNTDTINEGSGLAITKHDDKYTTTRYFEVSPSATVSYDKAKITLKDKTTRSADIEAPLTYEGTIVYFGISGSGYDLGTIDSFAIEGTQN